MKLLVLGTKQSSFNLSLFLSLHSLHIYLFLFLFLFIPSSSQAATFKIVEQGETEKRAEEIKEIVLDVENTCDRGCRFSLSNVREMRKITWDQMDPEREKEHFYMWVYVDSFKDFMYYSEVSVTNLEEGKIRISSVTPTASKIRQLRETFGRPHQTYFDQFNSHWTLMEQFDSEGNFTHTVVNYQAHVETESPLFRLFSGKLKREMRRTARELLANLR